MPDTPDYLVIGDSHSVALNNGLRRLGYQTRLVSFSGAKWHEGTFFYGRNGFECRGAATGMRSVTAIRKDFGVRNILDLGVPVIASFGFHLGLLLRPLGWFNHAIYSETNSGAEGPMISKSFAEDYLDHFRMRHFETAKKIARKASLIMVPPPNSYSGHHVDIVRSTIIERYESRDVCVYDAKDDFADHTGLIPKDLLREDGVHGTDEYGTKVIQTLFDRRYLEVPTSSALG